MLGQEIRRVHVANYSVYGIRKMHHAMARAGWEIGRDQVARLMKLAGVEGVRRGRKPITTRPTGEPDARPDLVERRFTAERPHRLWVVRHHLRAHDLGVLLESLSSPTSTPGASWDGRSRAAFIPRGCRCSPWSTPS
ncbi:IS3 family transposase [Micrococcus lacusdianchii]|uniref:IS3 family transposase n=1 Tax=Micrococcus lacusdianchii TaxID=2915940 RepID=UPI003AAD8263